ncbi:YxeA family protein [Furfurilactobacillus sp. WILCCON 0119]
MRKLWVVSGLIGVIICGIFFGLNAWDRYNKSGDIYYVHIIKDGKEEVSKDDNGRKFIDYRYELTAYNDKGDAKAVDFKGTQGAPLTLNSYLKLTVNPKKGVTQWEKVGKKQVPKKALEKFTN